MILQICIPSAFRLFLYGLTFCVLTHVEICGVKKYAMTSFIWTLIAAFSICGFFVVGGIFKLVRRWAIILPVSISKQVNQDIHSHSIWLVKNKVVQYCLTKNEVLQYRLTKK
jgi:hypothetical protein